ncbi:MAG TPA: hypothetical protein O0X39_04105 [Methanocorpusculum sp.]|nr:hypothetical protein [Methanocorpusculum sp.]
MRETQFPVIALGSVKPQPPDIEELGAWALKQCGKSADLTSWELESTLCDQPPCLTEPCAAGEFYHNRISAAFGITDGRIAGGFENNFDEIADDILKLQKIRRHFRWAVLVDCSICGSDNKKAGETEEEYCEVLSDLFRFMRDSGVDGHVLLGKPTEILLETFRGSKYLWVAGPQDFESLLETSSTLVCGTEDISFVEDLSDSYLIRKVLVKDADRASMERLLQTFDTDRLFCAGTAPESERKEYWAALSEVSARLSDK